MTEQLEQLRAQQYAELEALKTRHKEARRALRKKVYAEKRKAKRQKSPQKMQEEATRRAFYEAIAAAYETDDKKKLWRLAQLFRRRYGVNTAEGVAEVLKKRATRKAERAELRAKVEEKKQLKKEFLEAIKTGHNYSNTKCVHSASAWFRKERGFSSASDLLAYLSEREEKRRKNLELKQAREERKKAREERKTAQAAAQEAEIKRSKELLENGYLPLKQAADVFNKIRHEHGQPSRSVKGLWSHFFRHNVKTVFFKGSEYWYSSIDVKELALKNSKKARSQYLLSQAHFPVASASELDSGEWVSIKEFSGLAEIPEHLIRDHSRNHDFKMLTHPDTGVMLLHSATAAAHFLNFYQK
jgi:hypothetical protein